MTGGWVPRTEAAICLNCHRSLDFHWQISSDGRSLQPKAPAHVVDREPDAKNPDLFWVTMQARCRCGTTLGIVVDVSPALARAATTEV
jgi:hypothetical protein